VLVGVSPALRRPWAAQGHYPLADLPLALPSLEAADLLTSHMLLRTIRW